MDLIPVPFGFAPTFRHLLAPNEINWSNKRSAGAAEQNRYIALKAWYCIMVLAATDSCVRRVIWLLAPLLLASCSRTSDRPVDVTIDVVSKDEKNHQKPRNFLPEIGSIRAINVTNFSPPKGTLVGNKYPVHAIDGDRWRTLFEQLKDAMPVNVNAPLVELGQVDILAEDGQTTNVRIYYTEITGVIIGIETHGGDTSLHYFQTNITKSQIEGFLL